MALPPPIDPIAFGEMSECPRTGSDGRAIDTCNTVLDTVSKALCGIHHAATSASSWRLRTLNDRLSNFCLSSTPPISAAKTKNNNAVDGI